MVELSESIDEWINSICTLRIAVDNAFAKHKKVSEEISTNIQAISKSLKKLNSNLEKINKQFEKEESEWQVIKLKS